MRGQVVVRLRPEVLDPQGVTIGKALEHLGYDNVARLRQGKVFDVDLQADDPQEAERQLEEIARALLANPVIETFEVSILAEAEDA